jgi:ABC-type branched-subunit amino acid transport system permease subunit
LGLSIQYSYAGIGNLAYIALQAAGAYTAAVLTLGPSSGNANFQTYIGGYSFPFPIPVLAAAAVGAALSTLLGAIVLRRLRRDYQAMVFLIISIIAVELATNTKGLFNGAAGLALVPSPFQKELGLSYLNYHWLYAAYSIVVAAGVYVLCRFLGNSPLGIAWRACRDNEASAAAIGKNVIRIQLSAMAIGGAIAGLSGALLVQFITVWAPNSWQPTETFILFAALIVGGRGSNLGPIVGALVVPVLILQGPSFLPELSQAGLIDALSGAFIGLLTLGFLWFKPHGLVPEKARRFGATYRTLGRPRRPSRMRLLGRNRSI